MSHDPAVLSDPNRLRALRESALLDVEPVPSLDRLTWLASTFLRTPLALVNLIDDRRQFSHSAVLPEGWPEDRDAPLTDSFCKHVVIAGAPMVIADSREDGRTAESAFVGEHGLLAYVGVPLTTPDGHTLGALCVADRDTRGWQPEEVELLQKLAASAMTEIELRRDIVRRERVEALQAAEKRVLEKIGTGALLPEVLHTLVDAVELQGEMLASVLLREGTRLRHGAAGRLPEAFCQTIDGIEIGSVGTCATAAHRQERVIVEDTSRDPLWSELRDLATEHQLGACWAAPICTTAGDDVLGTFALYYREARTPTEYELGIIERAVYLARIAIERTRAQEALQRQEEHFRALTENALDIITVLEADGTIRYESPSVLRVLGFSPEELVGRNAFELIHPEDCTRAIDAFSRGVADVETPVDVEFRFLHKDGSWRCLQARGQNLLAHPAVRGFVVNSRDVTERRVAEEALIASEARYQRVIANAPGMVYQFVRGAGGTCHFPFVSEGSREIYGLEPWQIEQDASLVLDSVDPEDQTEFERSIAQSAEGLTPWIWEGRIHPAPGQTRWVRGISRPERQADGSVLWDGLFMDISEQREAQGTLAAQATELERSNRELEQFAYVASHDLQEPLRMVSSYVQLLERRYASALDQDAKEFIGFAVDGVRRMQQLIRDLLAFSRVGSRPPTLERLDLGVLLEDVLQDLALVQQECAAEIVHEGLPVVWADAGQMRQLLQNLVGNALKFRRPDVPPRVRLSAAEEEGRWRITVTDNGIGIAPEYHERIFQIFQRLHTRDEYEGTGIGLAVCKKIVERHGGTLSLHSVPGEGSTFSFALADARVEKAA